ncbi:MAG: hydrolase TatD [Ilumatobacter coccineus]|uniref:Hydrolase TatD n=1 Tax=Ilumatobacter coccineus TaxID=467094 RepID=A0A2G6KEP3_9ACTN|nr:MAG: hydrolase TatD [Ilumatobacter coccineus]
MIDWFDSHCHVHDERMPGGSDGAIEAARRAGVVGMVTVGTDRDTSLAALKIAERHDDVVASVGLHPHDAINGIDSILDLVERDDVVAIGEAGLDYYYDHSPRDVQREVFAAQINLAHTRRRPLIIHTRDAWEDTFDVLVAEGVPEGTIFHCFTGGPNEARRCLDLGAYVSFSGIVTFPKAPEVREAAALVPLDRLLVETDAPYLAPVPHRGHTNQPAWVTDTGRFLADHLDIPANDLARATTMTARSLFGRSPTTGDRPETSRAS